MRLPRLLCADGQEMVQLTKITLKTKFMSQTQPRYAFVCPKLDTLCIQHQEQSVRLESDCQTALADLAPLAIDAAMKRNIRVFLIDRHTGNQLDFYNFLMA